MTRFNIVYALYTIGCILLSAKQSWLINADTRTETQHHLSDGLPPPLPGAHFNVFTNRVLRWHEDYCGKDRLCHESSHMKDTGCYRCDPCLCDIHCHAFGDCCPDVALNDIAAGGLSRSDRLFKESITCESSQLQIFIPIIPTAAGSKGTTSQSSPKDDPIYGRYGQRGRLYHPKHAVASNVDPTQSLFGRETAIEKYFMISRCPNSFSSDSNECQNEGVFSPVSPAGHDGQGISSRDPPAVYRNLHCARCNGVYNVVPWNIRILCARMKNLASLTTPRNLTLNLAPDRDCAVTFTPPPPPHHHARACYTQSGVISSCNVTGAWRQRDSFLERACLSYITPKTINGKQYQNVFCFLCNHGGDEISLQLSLAECQRNPNLASVGKQVNKAKTKQPLTMTLNNFDITRELPQAVLFDGPTDKKCQEREVYDFKQKICRPVFCSVGQNLILGRCEPMFLSLSGVAYEFYFGLHPERPIDLSEDNDLLHLLPTEMEAYLSSVMLRNTVRIQDFAMAFNTTDPTGRCGQISQELAIYARVENLTAFDQASLQRELLDLRYARFTLNLGSWIMRFKAYPSERAWYSMHPSRRRSPQTLSACVIIVSNSHLSETRNGLRRVGTTTPNPAIIPDYPAPLIRISSLLGCPQVVLSSEEFTAPVDGPGGDLHLKWEETSNLTGNTYLMTIEGNVSICLENFLAKLGFDRSKRSNAEKIIVSVLLPISAMCLIATLSVYLAFSTLRTLPGNTNIIFVLCLLCSQATVFLVYLENDVRTQSCAVKGAIAHYFGLTVMVAQAACSYHVYTVFTTMHLSSVLKKEKIYLALYCIFTFILPLMIVVAVVIINMFPSSSLPTLAPGASATSSVNTQKLMYGIEFGFGYGGGALCLLTTPLAVWVSLLLPAVVFLVADVVLFAVTYYSLRHTMKDLETSSKDIRHVHFYFRISLLTTLAWVLAIVGHVTALSICRIAFVVIYFFVGCYTFFTLVLTRQVTRLVTGCCCGSRRPPMGRTSLNLKMVPVTDCHARNPCIVATGFKATGSGRRGGKGSGREASNDGTLRPGEIDYRQSGEYEPYIFSNEGTSQGVRFAESRH